VGFYVCTFIILLSMREEIKNKTIEKSNIRYGHF
jgi:hypothetical protein